MYLSKLPVCTTECIRKADKSIKWLLQIGHWCGLSPVCINLNTIE